MRRCCPVSTFPRKCCAEVSADSADDDADLAWLDDDRLENVEATDLALLLLKVFFSLVGGIQVWHPVSELDLVRKQPTYYVGDVCWIARICWRVGRSIVAATF